MVSILILTKNEEQDLPGWNRCGGRTMFTSTIRIVQIELSKSRMRWAARLQTGRLPSGSSSLACFKDFVRADFNGWIFDHRSPDGATNLANLLQRLLSETEMLKNTGAQAYRTARDYSLPAIAGQFLADFGEIVSA